MALAAIAARTSRVRLGDPRHGRHVPQPGVAREDGHDARRHLARPGGLRDRRGLARGRTRRLRPRLPADPRTHGPPRRGLHHRPADVHRGAADVRGPLLADLRGAQLPAAVDAGRTADPGGWRRRAADAADRRAARRLGELVRTGRRPAAQGRGAARGIARPSAATRPTIVRTTTAPLLFVEREATPPRRSRESPRRGGRSSRRERPSRWRSGCGRTWMPATAS